VIKVSEYARTALQDLLSREDSKGKTVRISVDDYT